MSNSWMIVVLLIISTSQSTSGSYHYVGCYSQVFYDSFFTSSFMEPTLCFRLCDTPIIYLQKTICRCSGGGLMHHNRQNNSYCTIPCTKPADRQVKTANTCGGARTYSAYIEEQFYTRHGHLFNYQIQFKSCELWNDSSIYDKYSIKLGENTIESSLNKIEQCAATCLDQNATTKLIAFNNDNNQCVCIMPLKFNAVYLTSQFITTLSNNSCNLYCNNSSTNKFQCGSLTDPRIWAVYNLHGACPNEFVYIKELQKCMYTYKYSWDACSSPAISYVYDGSVTWDIFLKMIERLNLKQSYVSIDFATNVVVNSSWKCSLLRTSTVGLYLPYVRPSYTSWYSKTRYMLSDGCLTERTGSGGYLTNLCITNPINKYSLASADNNNSSYIIAIDSQIKFCPANWFDLNGRCYSMSDERKTIEDARNSCITISKNDQSHFWSYDVDQVSDFAAGDIVQYIAPWQARLGFFLLDTVPENDESAVDSLNLYYEDLASAISNGSIHHSSVNEFHMSDSNMTDNSCVVSTRMMIEEDERPILKSIQTNNCSKRRHVLCETNTLIIRNFQQACLRKPLIIGLPAMISNQLTYELCLSVCQELQTKIAVIHINKCYCLNGFISEKFNLMTDLEKYQETNCGNTCEGNENELCGNENTIIAFHILDSRRTYTDAGTPAEPFPDFIYDSCINVNFFDRTATYKFNLYHPHPRLCLELCTKYQQKYALIRSNKCFCTNIPIKDEEYDFEILSNEHCSQKCSANYFYSCGNENNSTIYSMYIMQPKCRHGYEVAENDQQCVYSHFSAKKKSFSDAQNYCKSIDGVIAKINDILEIQDILPNSILKTRLLKDFPAVFRFHYFNDTKFFWINRTLDIPDNNTISDRIMKKCSQTSGPIDRNCIKIHYEKTSYDNITSYERCITESNQCSSISAIPICVDQHLENNSTTILPITDDNSVDTPIDYSCGDNTDYHFVDDYCYKISLHEASWIDAKSECEGDNAMLFVPEKSITLQIIKSLFLRRDSYTSSSFAHVGVVYDNQNRTVIQYNTTDQNTIRTVPDSNAVYDLCEKTFHERYAELILSRDQRNRLKDQQTGCAYIDLLSYTAPVIRCDEIPCNRTAIVICQKSPTVKMDDVQAQRESIEIPPSIDPSPTSIASLTDDLTTTESSDVDSQENPKSVITDFAPIFFILSLIFALIVLGFISTLHNRRLSRKNNTGTRNNTTIYSQLTAANEFDLN